MASITWRGDSMIRIAICDDNMRLAHELEEQIQHMPFNNIETEIFLSGDGLLRQHSLHERYNIILMDIEMPSVNGIEAAIEIRKTDPDVVLIFVTAYKEYVYQTFEALPFRFLQKPISYEMLFNSISDAVNYINEQKNFFFFKKAGGSYQIATKEILYFEGANRKIKLFAMNNMDIFYGKIKQLMEQLNPDYFLRIHTSYIINMDYITSFSDKEVVLADKFNIPVSLKYKEQARLEHLKFVERRCGKW